MSLARPMALGAAALACIGSPGVVAPADSKVLGTYECRTGSSAALTLNRPPLIEENTPDKPAVRITVSSLDIKAKPQMEWWNSKTNTWKEEIGTELWISRVEVKDTFWAITFEGVFGDRLAAAASAMLSHFPGAAALVPSQKPVFVFTQLAPIFAGAGIYSCDKL
jgi:hypothetical protein